jgi:hypothetical protein
MRRQKYQIGKTTKETRAEFMDKRRIREDIWLKILTDKKLTLGQIPGFIRRNDYDEVERSLYPEKELGKIVTRNYNFRFCVEPFKIEIPIQ